jgi:hypothetical protein
MKKEHHMEEHHTIYTDERYIESGTVGGEATIKKDGSMGWE